MSTMHALRPTVIGSCCSGPRRVASGNCGSTRSTDARRNGLTPNDLVAQNPVWSPDGEWVYFTDASNNAVARIRGDFTGEIETIAEDLTANPRDVSPDGRELAVTLQVDAWDIGVIDIETGEFEELVRTPAVEFGARYSPDGRFLSYGSNESGEYEAYVRDLQNGRRYVASTEGGGAAYWSPDGRTLYFANGQRPDVGHGGDGAGRSVWAQPVELFELNARAGFHGTGWMLPPDGERILILTSEGLRPRTKTASPLPARSTFCSTGPRCSANA